VDLSERPGADDPGGTRRQRTGIAARPVSLRRLRVAGVLLPLLFVLVIELIRGLFVENNYADYSPHIVLAAVTVVAIIGFSFVMFRFVARAQSETAEVVTNLQRRQREGHAFYDVLLRISNQDPLAEILADVARNCRDLLAGDRAAVCLNAAATRSVQLDPPPTPTPAPAPAGTGTGAGAGAGTGARAGAGAGAAFPRDGVCIVPDGDGAYELHDLRHANTLRSSPAPRDQIQADVHTSGRAFGELFVGRASAVPFEERDRQYLRTFSDIASIAVTSARLRESERQGAILAERERIARELHDSLAQVLGAVHLRLRSLASREEAVTAAVALELIELADVCDEGYGDARGAILDLRESSRVGRGLIDSLRAYLEKYSGQCGIAATLQANLGHDLVLPPRSEIQIIRVVQEALTNVRKHSGASAATVCVAESGGTVTFVVEDDGCGFDAAEAADSSTDGDGFGLHSMGERMELIGGTLSIDSVSGRGTRVVAELPAVPARTPIPSI
jgi:signal transduction histidine kinase